MDIKEAMGIVTKAIKEDEGYRIGWQANIAMAFYDEYNKSNSDTIINISNRAADNFLRLLTRDVKWFTKYVNSKLKDLS